MSTKEPLYHHRKHQHRPTNVNERHAEEMQGVNARIAVFLTRVVGSMPTAYVFVCLASVGLLAIIGVFSPLVATLIAWISQTLLQLTLLPVIMVGQNVLNRHAELLAEETYQQEIHNGHDIDELIAHLDAQDAKFQAIHDDIQAIQEQLSQITRTRRKTEGLK